MTGRIAAGGKCGDAAGGRAAQGNEVGMVSCGIEDVAGAPVGERVARPGSVSVLVVDDSRVFRRGMVRAVQSCAGLRLAGEADGGEAALEAIARLEPDLVLLDLRMPGIDGLEVLARLGEIRVAQAPRVVVVSASLDDAIEDRARAAGADACLSKALSRADICTAALHVACG